MARKYARRVTEGLRSGKIEIVAANTAEEYDPPPPTAIISSQIARKSRWFQDAMRAWRRTRRVIARYKYRPTKGWHREAVQMVGYTL